MTVKQRTRRRTDPRTDAERRAISEGQRRAWEERKATLKALAEKSAVADLILRAFRYLEVVEATGRDGALDLCLANLADANRAMGLSDLPETQALLGKQRNYSEAEQDALMAAVVAEARRLPDAAATAAKLRPELFGITAGRKSAVAASETRHRHKSVPAEVKSVTRGGMVDAIVSVFGNVDLQGDRVIPGAFAKSLEKWRASGDPIPVIWSHDWGNPMSHIGKVLRATETPRGLRVEYQLDLDNPVARQVHKLLQERRVKEHSFSYDVVKEWKARDANELVELDLIEVGPTLKGANPATELLGVKSRAATRDLDAEMRELEAFVSKSRPAASARPEPEPAPFDPYAEVPKLPTARGFFRGVEPPTSEPAVPSGVRISPTFRPVESDPETKRLRDEVEDLEERLRLARQRLERRLS